MRFYISKLGFYTILQHESKLGNIIAVVHVGVLDYNIVLVNQGLSMSVKIWLTPQLQSAGNFTFSSAQV